MAKKSAQDRRLKKVEGNPLVKPYVDNLKLIGGGDKAIYNALLGGASLGNQLFRPGSLGRLDENVLSDPNVADLLSRTKTQLNAPIDTSGIDIGIDAAKNALNVADINNPLNQEVLAGLRGQLTATPDEEKAIGLLRDAASGAGNVSSLEQELLDLRRSNVNGMNLQELQAAKEGGVIGPDGSFVPGIAAINRSAASALATLGGNNLVNRRGISTGSLPVVQGAQGSAADLNRALILDQYRSKQTGQTNLADALTGVQGNIDSRVNNLTANYSNAAGGLANRLTNANSNFGSFVQGTAQNMASTASNLGNMAQNRATFMENTLSGRLDRFMTTIGNIRNEQLYRTTFNMNQIDREKAGMVSSIFGAGSFGAQRQGTKEANDIAKQQLEAAKSFGGGGNPWGGRQGTSSGTSSGTNSNSDTFDQAMQ